MDAVTNTFKGGSRMISVGIDVSKGKSTICILKPYGEIVRSPFDVQHTNSELESLVQILEGLDEEFRIAMEATGAYHYPILYYLKEKGYFVTLVNPLEMKRYRCQGLRNPKTDRIDAKIIATYVLDYWNSIKDYAVSDAAYAELRLLTRQYRKYMDFRVGAMTSLTDILDMTMPGIRTVLIDWNKYSNNDPLSDFSYDFWHYDNVKKYSKEEFIEEYAKWAKEKGFRRSETKAVAIYELAHEEIPTVSSSTPSTKMLVQEAVKLVREINNSLYEILTRMQELAKELPEYQIVRNMSGVGDTLAPRLIGEIGDVRRFPNASALIAYAGIDAPPYQSGRFTGTERHISKRGSSNLRKIGFETMTCANVAKKPDDPVYLYMQKKKAEGKPGKVAKIAGMNKFLRIYYARVKEIYKE